MGWIKELEDVASKSKKMRILIISAIVAVVLMCVAIGFLVIKKAYQGQPVTVGPIQLQADPTDKRNPDSTNKPADTDKRSTPTDLTDSKPAKHHKANPESPKTTGNSMKIDSGGSGIQNNAPNYGNQAGRDLNISNEKQLEQSDIQQINYYIDKAKKEYGFHNNIIEVLVDPGTNAGKFISQLKKYLLSKGYTIIDGFSLKLIEGVRFSMDGENLNIEVGTR